MPLFGDQGQSPVTQNQCSTESVTRSPLLNFLVWVVLTAEGAEFLHFQPFRRGLLILHAGVVLALTLGALKCDVLARHYLVTSLFQNFRYRAGADRAPTLA